MLTYIRTTSSNADFQKLVVLLDDYLTIIDGEEHAFYDQFNKIENINHAILCYDNNELVGCGAFKQYATSVIEIKRMYVTPECRDKGIGLEILNELEKWANELHFTESILETGKKQLAAIRLYEKAGYIITGNFGQYANMSNSICMKKSLL
ncbi:MAG: GNAT family N-acetyltransferase [Ferruginibacter sp.]